MGPYLFLTALLWRPSVVKWTTQQYRVRWGGITEIYSRQSNQEVITAAMSAVSATSITYDTTPLPQNYCSTYQQQPSSNGFITKVKV